MKEEKKKKAELRKKIEEVLSADHAKHPGDKSIGELVEEISIYHRELEFQNDELRRTQLELEESKEHFNSLFEHAPVGYVVCNEAFRIESFNQRFRDMIPLSRDARGVPVNQFIDPASQDDFYFFLRDLSKKRGNKPVRVEVTMTDTTHSIPVKIEGNRFRKGKKNFFRLAISSLVQQKETENRLRQKSADLGERVKELQCLYDISRFTEDKTLGVDELMQKVVERIPASWRFPGETVARIVINGKKFTSQGFRETRWSLSRDISIGSHTTGRIEVCYTTEKPESDIGPFMKEERDLLNGIGSYLEQYLEREQSEQELRTIEWMLQGRAEKEMNYVPPHGQLNELNKNGMILGLVGEEQLKEIASDYLDLLETSAAIYERNGDYALGMFSSGWCRMMDSASRQLCGTDDNREAMESGKWLCHESCWQLASLRSMKEDRPVDVSCSGGIKLYALPVKANGKVVGSINFGYGDPPKDEETLRELSETYQVPLEKLREKARSYPSRPRYIIDTAKKRLHNSAMLLGSLIERHLAQQELLRSNENLRITLNSIGDAVIATDTKGNVARMNPVAERMTGWTLEEAQGKKLSTVFKIINAQTRKKVSNPVRRVLETGNVVGLANHTLLISRSGQEYQIADSGAPIRDANGKITGVVMVFRDVSQEYRMQQQIAESEQQLKQAQEIGKMGSWSFNLETGRVTASDQARRIYGYEPGEELTIKQVQEIPLEDFRPQLDEALENLVHNGKPYNQEFLIRNRKDGRLLHVRSMATYTPEDKTVTGIIQDITDIKVSEQKYRSLFSSIRDAILVTDTNRKIIRCNPAFTELFGYKEDEILGKETSTIYKDLREFEEMGSRLRDNMGDPNFILTISYRKKSGELFRGETNVFYLKNSTGEIEGFIGMIRDVTDRIVAEEMLRESEEKMRSLFRVAPVGIGMVRERNIQEVNATVCSMTGYSREELIGKNARILYPTREEYDRVGALKYSMILESGMGTVETRWQRKSGEILDIYLASTAIDKEDLGRGAIFTALDITERKHHEKELQGTIAELEVAKKQAEESDRLKSAFLANVSHEIRTPMNGILGFLNLLRRPNLTKEKRENYLDIVNRSGERLLTTINDIVEISKIESDQAEVLWENVSITQVINHYVEFFKPQAEARNIDLRVDCRFDPDQALIRCDRSKLDSILNNLVRNALKFTDRGSIEVGCKRAGEWLELFVTDTGRGISEERKDAIFDRFVQADLAISRSYEGSGLGLSITKAYVEMLGGTIEVDSAVGEGSTFTVKLPYYPAGTGERKITEQAVPMPGVDGSKKVILVAEDDETSYNFLEILLSEQNYQVIRASDGNEAVKQCRENPGISLVLMDLKMPGMDGHEATRQIRKFNKDLPVIAQTAYVQKDEAQKALRAGCNAFIEKPIDVSKLNVSMARFL